MDTNAVYIRTFGVLEFFLHADKTPGAQQLRDLYLAYACVHVHDVIFYLSLCALHAKRVHGGGQIKRRDFFSLYIAQ